MKITFKDFWKIYHKSNKIRTFNLLNSLAKRPQNHKWLEDNLEITKTELLAADIPKWVENYPICQSQGKWEVLDNEFHTVASSVEKFDNKWYDITRKEYRWLRGVNSLYRSFRKGLTKDVYILAIGKDKERHIIVDGTHRVAALWQYWKTPNYGERFNVGKYKIYIIHLRSEYIESLFPPEALKLRLVTSYQKPKIPNLDKGLTNISIRWDKGFDFDRFVSDNNGVVLDTKANLEWLVGPDKDTNWHEAKEWVGSLGNTWRMPTVDELETLYIEGLGTCNMTPLLKTTEWCVWSGETKKEEDGTSSAWVFSFNFNIGKWNWCNRIYCVRGFAVRSRVILNKER